MDWIDCWSRYEKASASFSALPPSDWAWDANIGSRAGGKVNGGTTLRGNNSWVGEVFTTEGTRVLNAGFTAVLPHLAMNDKALPQYRSRLLARVRLLYTSLNEDGHIYECECKSADSIRNRYLVHANVGEQLPIASLSVT